MATIGSINLLIQSQRDPSFERNFAESLAGVRGFGKDADTALEQALSNINKNAAAMGVNVRQALSDGRAVFAETRTEAERYATTIEKLDTLLKVGAVSEETYGRAVNQVKEKMEAAAGGNEAMAAAMDVAKTAAVALVGAMGVEELVEFGKEQLNVIDHSYRLAQALQVPVGVLQGLESAGFIKANLSAEQFDTTLDRMTKDIGKAAEEGGETAKALELMRLNVQEVAAMRPDRQFELIAEKIHEIPNPVLQAAAAVAIFGRTGQDLLPVFQQSATGIRDAAAEARGFGTAMSEMDAEKTSEAAEGMRRLKEEAAGAANSFVTVAAPAIVGALDDIVNHIHEAEDDFAKLTGGRTNAQELARNLVLDAGHAAGHAAYESQDAGQAASQANVYVDPTDAISKQSDYVNSLKKQLNAENDLLEAKKARVGQADDTYSHEKAEVDATVAAIEKMKAEIGSQTQVLASYKAEQQRWNESIATDAVEAFLSATHSAAEYRSELNQLEKQMASGQIGQDAFEGFSDRINAAKTDAEELDRTLTRLTGKQSLSPEQQLGSDVGLLTKGLEQGKVGWSDYWRAIGADYEKFLEPAMKAAEEQSKKTAAAAKEWADKVGREHESLETKAEKYADKLKEIEELHKHGLSDTDYQRALAEAKKEEDGDQGPDDRRVGASTRFGGSRSDFYVPGAMQAKQHSDSAKATEDMHQTLRQHLKEAQAQTKDQDEIYRLMQAQQNALQVVSIG
jgi:hypothetical protein